jgi:hypothetical protein
MDLVDEVDLVANIVSALTLLISLYIFFTDKFRRWIFMGYKPTAMVIVLDYKNDKTLLTRRDAIYKSKRKYMWHFPQGGIFSQDLNSVVDNILEREFEIKPSMYDFHKTLSLGIVRIRGRSVEKKHFYGWISVFSRVKGKGYVACMVHTDLKKFVKQIKPSFGLNEVRIVDFDKALEMIDPEKKKFLKKYKRQILSN